MAWSAPYVWTVGEILTAAKLQTYLSDELTALIAPYTGKGYIAGASAANTPAPIAPGSDYWGLGYLAANSNGVAKMPQATILKAVAYQYQDTSAAEVDVCSTTLPGGVLGSTTAFLKYEMWIDPYVSSSSYTLTLKFYYGSQSVTWTSTYTINSTTGTMFECKGIVSPNNATNAQTADGYWMAWNSGGIPGPGPSGLAPAALTVDSTAAQTVKMTVQMSSSNSAFKWRVLGATIMAIPAGTLT
jgi:hypothetical protein